MVLECLSKEALSGPTVSALRDQNIDDIAVLVDRPPQVVAFAPDRNEQFIDVPDVSEPPLFPSQGTSISRTKLCTPVSNRLV